VLTVEINIKFDKNIPSSVEDGHADGQTERVNAL
jgi:hypothetical protein